MRGPRSLRFRPTAVVICLLSCAALGRAEDNWPGWGGPLGNSHTSDTGLPLNWDDSHVLWKVDLPGAGQSTPVIWGRQIFLTAALDKGRQRVVLCVDRHDGKLLWKHVAWTGEPEPSHAMNGWASATCATNGRVVVAFFGRGGLHGYALDGQHLWSRDLGQFAGPWGTAASPIFHGDTVIQNCDSESPEAALLAVDYRTGQTVWNTPRTNVRGWSTPVVIRTPKREELILNSHAGVRSYDPATGAELWWCQGFNGRGEPVPAYGHGLLFCVNGLAGDIYAVRPGGTGDVTAEHRVWHTPRRAGRDLPSPVVIDNYLLVLSMAGILTCYDSGTGRELWKERIGEKFSASPLVAEGRAYMQSDAGETLIVKPGDKLDIVGRGKLSSDAEELFRAALVPSQGKFFIRSSSRLYCVGPVDGETAGSD